ncbi:hypothetical protein DFS34DRAFT_632411 [Phlyctochytrium arcticum]|nr:hypothetical protein DFS34DRAFT_632411 [Phlyctochytrium arcticum]
METFRMTTNRDRTFSFKSSTVEKLGFPLCRKASRHIRQNRLELKSWSINDQSLLGILENCRSLTELTLSHCWKISRNALVNILPRLKNLRRLKVAGIYTLGDDFVRGICQMCPLQEVIDLRY